MNTICYYNNSIIISLFPSLYHITFSIDRLRYKNPCHWSGSAISTREDHEINECTDNFYYNTKKRLMKRITLPEIKIIRCYQISQEHSKSNNKKCMIMYSSYYEILMYSALLQIVSRALLNWPSNQRQTLI